MKVGRYSFWLLVFLVLLWACGNAVKGGAEVFFDLTVYAGIKI